MLLIIGAAIGAVCSVVFPLFKVIPIISLLLKFLVSCVLVCFLGKNSSFKSFTTKLLMFYMLTFVLGGISYALLGLMNANFAGNLLAYDASVPLGVILLGIFIYIRIIDYLARMLYKKRTLRPFLREITLIISNKQLKMRALLDSGNGLVERKTGLPVVIISLSSLMRVYSLKDIQSAIETGKSNILKNIRFINYSTVAGDSKKMLIFEADEMIIEDGEKCLRNNNFVLGLSTHEFKSKEDFELLLNPAML